MFKKVDTNMNFVEREKEVEEFWRAEGIFEKSIAQHEGDPSYVFYDGPPTANGKPCALRYPFAEDSLRKPALCSLFARDSPRLPPFPANLLRLPGPPSVRPCPRSVQPCPYSVRSLLLHSQSLSERST